jgi:hypothetical protein
MRLYFRHAKFSREGGEEGDEQHEGGGAKERRQATVEGAGGAVMSE